VEADCVKRRISLKTPLRFGDALLIQGLRSRIQLLRSEKDFLVLEEDTATVQAPRRAWLALGLTAAAILLAALEIAPVGIEHKVCMQLTSRVCAVSV
jgi:hypothetical protein